MPGDDLDRRAAHGSSGPEERRIREADLVASRVQVESPIWRARKKGWNELDDRTRTFPVPGSIFPDRYGDALPGGLKSYSDRVSAERPHGAAGEHDGEERSDPEAERQRYEFIEGVAAAHARTSLPADVQHALRARQARGEMGCEHRANRGRRADAELDEVLRERDVLRRRL